tara:strand:- start:335 stop:577 length:243 start_codon:yes stop_codon:yes gene_type:complete
LRNKKERILINSSFLFTNNYKFQHYLRYIGSKNQHMKNQKNKVIAMRLTPEDNQFIEEQAEKERLTKSSWMRRQIFLKQE